jgi:hypothetical protein
LAIGRTCRDLFANDVPEITRHVRARRLDAFILANNAAQLSAYCFGPQLQRPIVQHLARVAHCQRLPSPN